MYNHRKHSRQNPLTMSWIFPHSPILRGLFVLMVIFSILIAIRGVYHYYQLQQQEELLLEERTKLSEEKDRLQQKKEDLQDPQKLEKKARDELGLVKPGEVPYVR